LAIAVCFLTSIVTEAQTDISSAYVFTTFDVPVNFGTSGVAFNDRGQIIANGMLGQIADGEVVIDYTNGSPVTFPGSRFTEVKGMNNLGHIVGIYWDNVAIHGFFFDGRTYTTIDYPNAPYGQTLVYGINNLDLIVGEAGGRGHGFVFYPKTKQFVNVDVPYNVPWKPLNTEPHAINDRGQIAGVYWGLGDEPHVFWFDGKRFIVVEDPPLPYFPARGNGINNNGQIVGSGIVSGCDFYQCGFLLQKGVIGLLTFPGTTVSGLQTYLLGINNSGQILGQYWDDSQNNFTPRHYFLATPVQ
jgi:hypothetical protein